MSEIVLEVPQDLVNNIQRADVEQSSRKDILIYLMEHPELNITQERRDEYHREYDDKYLAFEQAKTNFEKTFIQPAANNKAVNWNLDYNACQVTITVEE